MSAIRFGNSGDFYAIQAVERSAGLLFRGTQMDWAVGEVTESADLADAASLDLLWVSETDGAISGFLLAEGFATDFHIWELSVGQAWQGSGIGRLLIETAFEEAARRGFTKATLTTDRTLAWNGPWYQRLGFKEPTAGEISARLAIQLASEPFPDRRCAMIRSLTCDGPVPR